MSTPQSLLAAFLNSDLDIEWSYAGSYHVPAEALLKGPQEEHRIGTLLRFEFGNERVFASLDDSEKLLILC